MKCCVFGAGDYNGECLAATKDAFLIAADGGLDHVKRYALEADLVIGDFDSLRTLPKGDNVIVHPVMKDDTDMALAVKEGLLRGCDEFYLFGGMGGRIDHTLANLSLLVSLSESKIPAYLVGKEGVITVLSGGEALVFDRSCRGIVSVFSVGERALGVTLSGLLYPLEKSSLTNTVPLGVSNHFIGEEASLSSREGALLVVWDSLDNPFPLRVTTE